MSYLRCDGSITQSVENFPSCDSGWLVIPDSSVESIFQSITIADSLEITAQILILWSIAFGVRLLLRMILQTTPGRF